MSDPQSLAVWCHPDLAKRELALGLGESLLSSQKGKSC